MKTIDAIAFIKSQPAKTRQWYALHWISGYGTKFAIDGTDVVHVHAFDSSTERDEACRKFRAPSHCPTARLEAVPANNSNVRYELALGGLADNDRLPIG